MEEQIEIHFLHDEKAPSGLEEICRPATMYTLNKNNLSIEVTSGQICIGLWSKIYSHIIKQLSMNKDYNETCGNMPKEELKLYNNHIWIYNDNPKYDTAQKRYAAILDIFIEKEYSINKNLKHKLAKSDDYLDYLKRLEEINDKKLDIVKDGN